MTETEFKDLYNGIAKLAAQLDTGMEQATLEKQIVITKITEAGMWFRMYWDMNKPREAEVHIVPKSVKLKGDTNGTQKEKPN
jgi:hypothetical protein